MYGMVYTHVSGMVHPSRESTAHVGVVHMILGGGDPSATPPSPPRCMQPYHFCAYMKGKNTQRRLEMYLHVCMD